MYALSNQEKAYLRRIVINTRNEYLKTEKYKRYEEIELIEELDYSVYMQNKIEESIDNIDNAKIVSNSIENIFSDEVIMKNVKALTLREKLVLFSYYFENNTDQEIGNALNLKGDTIRKIRVRTLEKIRKNYIGGGNKNV